MISTNSRKARGQAIIVASVVIAFIFLLGIGLYAFELNRVEVARQQLQSACEAAALSGAATLAGSDEHDPFEAHNNAVQTALNSFRANSVAGFTLAGANLAMDANTNPQPRESALYIEFLDPRSNNRVVNLGDPNGKVVKAYGVLGFVPAFGAFLGIGNVPLRAVASGGVPQLDVVLCFDVSASIDDQTPVTFVKRQWNSTTNRIDYNITNAASGSRAGTRANGRIYDIIGPLPTGSACDGLPPQTLAATNQSDHRWRLQFSPALRGSNNNSPPGNLSNPSMNITNTMYSDLVVNLDGRNVFAGASYQGYDFPTLGVLVEAARGNLEDANVFASSRANSGGLPSTIQPRAGYRNAYIAMARQNLQPLKDAQDACQVFLDIMNTNTDAHFSLVSFTSRAGDSETDSISMPNVDSSYGAGGSGNFPNRLIGLRSAPTETQYQSCRDSIGNTIPISGTNIGDAVYTAVQELTSSRARQGSKKAIVVFTDGQPTSGGPLDSGDAWRNARLAAVRARNAGIPIYTIGLAQVPEIIPGETAILNDTNRNESNGGIAGIAGNGGKFWLVTNNANLRLTFENLARQLVQLVR